ncbi:MAG: hypothetical protein IPJ73_18560 [Zoogloea sp.]|nr:hypothetical protein [Zoogloea sp.]
MVVTSGTGSGKTGNASWCRFWISLRVRMRGAGRELIGGCRHCSSTVERLIQSQRERLNAWTSSFGDGLRFCLYNGLTQKQPQGLHDQMRNEVLDRGPFALPPPLLVTNATMLEYMLVRAQDAPILEQSQGAQVDHAR